MAFDTVNLKNGKVVLLDQTLLPGKTIYRKYDDPERVAVAIEKMIVRGAPAIGVTAALGLALVARRLRGKSLATARKQFNGWAKRFSRTRPTAVNLFWAIQRMQEVSGRPYKSAAEWAATLHQEGLEIREEDIEACKTMGRFGAELIPPSARILTHCNAGALATAGWGTALGVIRSAAKAGKKIAVYADETRPFLQGSRLTAWELEQERIPYTLITDNMAGHFMSRGEIDLVIVGADRIAANGDVANKIGTYTVAVVAHANEIPFYVAAPLSTIDLNCPSGDKIPIEERNPKEVKEFAGVLVAPKNAKARHPAFDVTPSRYVTAIITEKGVARPPYSESLREFKR